MPMVKILWISDRVEEMIWENESFDEEAVLVLVLRLRK